MNAFQDSGSKESILKVESTGGIENASRVPRLNLVLSNIYVRRDTDVTNQRRRGIERVD